MNGDIEFLFRIVSEFSTNVINSYANLPPDNYLHADQIFRERRFTKVKIDNADSNIITDFKFHQTNELNHYAGGFDRVYEPLEPEVCDEFIDLFNSSIGPVFNNSKFEIGLHQIRITCNDHYVGHPVPEGWHHDGFDYVAIVCVSASNFCGGTSRIRMDLNSDHDTFSKILQPSEMMIFNDRRYYHHTDPINNRISGSMGYRDILVLTVSLQ
jgi:hypothetical protein